MRSMLLQGLILCFKIRKVVYFYANSQSIQHAEQKRPLLNMVSYCKRKLGPLAIDAQIFGIKYDASLLFSHQFSCPEQLLADLTIGAIMVNQAARMN
jgi:hypothetical protein